MSRALSNDGGVANSMLSCGEAEAAEDAAPGVCSDAAMGVGEPDGDSAGAGLDGVGNVGDADGSGVLPLTGRTMYSTLNGSAP